MSSNAGMGTRNPTCTLVEYGIASGFVHVKWITFLSLSLSLTHTHTYKTRVCPFKLQVHLVSINKYDKKFSKKKGGIRDAEKGLKPVEDVHSSALLHPQFTLMCDITVLIKLV